MRAADAAALCSIHENHSVRRSVQVPVHCQCIDKRHRDACNAAWEESYLLVPHPRRAKPFEALRLAVCGDCRESHRRARPNIHVHERPEPAR